MTSLFPIVYPTKAFLTGFAILVVAAGGSFGSMRAFAQDDSDGAAAVGITATFIPKLVPVGGKTVLNLKLKLPAGTHSNSDSPTDPDLIPTAFFPKAHTGISWGHPRYPTPKKVVEWYADEPLSVFQDGAVITVDVTVGQTVSKGRLALEGTLHIQLCDSEKCYPPRQLPVRADLEVTSELNKPRTEERNSNPTNPKSPTTELSSGNSSGQNAPSKTISASKSFTDEAVEFEFVDFAGKPRKLSEFRGKVLLLDFWATWCKPCLADIPKLKMLYEKYKAKGFEIIGMSSETLTGDDEKPDPDFAMEAGRRARQIVLAHGVSWTQATSETAVPRARFFGVKALPAKILIDREGRVITTIGEKDDLTGIVEKLLSLKP